MQRIERNLLGAVLERVSCKVGEGGVPPFLLFLFFPILFFNFNFFNFNFFFSTGFYRPYVARLRGRPGPRVPSRLLAPGRLLMMTNDLRPTEKQNADLSLFSLFFFLQHSEIVIIMFSFKIGEEEEEKTGRLFSVCEGLSKNSLKIRKGRERQIPDAKLARRLTRENNALKG